MNYTYNILQENIKRLKAKFPFLEIGNIGYSVMHKELSYIRIGVGEKEVFYSASYHANEWITTPVLMKFIEKFCYEYINNGYIFNYNAKNIFNSTSIYIVPMVNPDGVDLVTGELEKQAIIENNNENNNKNNNKNNNENKINIGAKTAYKNAKKIAMEFPDIPFPDGWKANILGTDLNLQFPAKWKKAREIKFSQGYNKPAPRDYVGIAPLAAPESKAIYEFTTQHEFRLILAYHTQGETIYWRYSNYLPIGSYFIGEQFSKASGYILEETPLESGYAGYKDWFIQEYNRPGYTIECGLGENPLPISQFDKIYNDNEGILVLGAIL